MKTQRIGDFYQYRFGQQPLGLALETGHLNVFRLEEYVGNNARPMPFSRRDYYKISLITGPTRIDYAHTTQHIEKRGLLFSNPQIPYSLEHLPGEHGGYVCIFTAAFFHQFGRLADYAVFQPGGTPVFELNETQTATVAGIFERLLAELDSDYRHKHDVMRNLVFELLHFAGRMTPSAGELSRGVNAHERISLLFSELLERQFPIDDSRQRLHLRSAAGFAAQLAVHVNHLNRALKETSGKTTSAIIAERILLEAKTMLRNTRWNVSEIAYALGFGEASNFNNFFRKYCGISPTAFRRT